MTDATGAPVTSELMEALAAAEHARWSHWQRYLHSRCFAQPDGSLTIPPELVETWARQMATPYSELSEREKQSDREQVARYLPLVADAIIQGARAGED